MKLKTVSLATLLIILFFIHSRGIFYPDEGYMINAAKRIIDGDIIYKDFQFVYTPFVPIFTSLFFILFGESLLSARIAAMTLSLGSVIVLYKLFKIFAKNNFPILVSILLFISWGPMHINFMWPGMTSVFFCITACYTSVIAYMNKSNKYYFLTGILLSLILLTKPNLGASVLFGVFFSLLIMAVKSAKVITRKNIVNLLLGVTSAICGFILFIYFQGSISYFLESMNLNLIQKILIENTISTPLVYGNSLYSYLKFIFYFSPIILSIFAAIIAYTRKPSLLIPSIMCLFFCLAGVRPVTDYVHISPLIALSCVPFFILILLLNNDKIKKILIPLQILTIAIGIYLPVFVHYYRWNQPFINQTVFVSSPRVKIWLDQRHAKEITEITNKFKDKKKGYVFINYYAPMLYFIIDMQNPTRFDYISPTAISLKEQNEVISNLKNLDVPFVLTHDLAKTDTSVIAKYINYRYRVVDVINDLTILEKK